MKGFGRALVALTGAAALAVGLAACGSSDSGGNDTVSLRLGYVTTPQHPYGITVDAFAKEVSDASGGKITIQTVPGASSGNDVTLLDDVSGGTIEMGAISTAVWDSKGVNVFQPLQAPFLITSYGLAEAVEGGDIGYGMLDSPDGPAKLGLHGLGILEGGLRKPLGAKKALVSPAAFAGMKIRAPASKVMTDGLKALGAEPVAMPLPDVYQGLKSGAVNGMEANYGLIFTQKYYEVAKYVTADVTLWPFPAAVVINQKVWDGLTSEQQQILTDAGKNIAKNSANIFLNPAPDATNFVAELCKAGMVFAAAGDANRAALAAKAQPAIDALLANDETKDFVTQIQALKDSLGPPPAPPALPAGCKTS
jgi:TRAP-type C4-dicarboxylate transport system substrate-binding protein